MVQWQQPCELKAPTTKSEPPSPTKELEVVQQVMLPPGFMGVIACLWRDQLPEEVQGVPQDPFRLAAILTPTVGTMSASCIIRDKVMGVTYMDTMTTSVG